MVLADAGYGMSAAFRHGLDARGLIWAVGIPRTQKVYTPKVRLRWPRARTGRPRQRPERGAAVGGSGAGQGDVAPPELATGHLGQARRALRHAARPGGRRANHPDRPSPARTGSLAARRVARERRAQILPEQSAAKDAKAPAGGRRESALGLRAGAPTAQARAGPRPFRRTLMDRAAPTCADDRHRVCLSAACAPCHSERTAKRGALSQSAGPPPQPSLPAVRRAIIARLNAHPFASLICPRCKHRFRPQPCA